MTTLQEICSLNLTGSKIIVESPFISSLPQTLMWKMEMNDNALSNEDQLLSRQLSAG